VTNEKNAGVLLYAAVCPRADAGFDSKATRVAEEGGRNAVTVGDQPVSFMLQVETAQNAETMEKMLTEDLVKQVKSKFNTKIHVTLTVGGERRFRGTCCFHFRVTSSFCLQCGGGNFLRNVRNE
jgi:hypothetical protein